MEANALLWYALPNESFLQPHISCVSYENYLNIFGIFLIHTA